MAFLNFKFVDDKKCELTMHMHSKVQDKIKLCAEIITYHLIAYQGVITHYDVVIWNHPIL